MFARLGLISAAYRWPILAFWLAAAVFITLLAPNIDEVAVNDQRAFLPDHTPSLDAIDTVKKYFPNRVAPSSTVVVLDAGAQQRVDQGTAGVFLRHITDWLSGNTKPPTVDRVLSPISSDQQTAKALMSKDGRVGLLVVSFSQMGTEEPVRRALDDIAAQLRSAPHGTSAYMTGDASIVAAYDDATHRSLDSTTWITIVLVIVILLLVYRSPVSPLIPLATITLAYFISRGVVAFLGEGVMTISGYTNIFIIVVLFGAGTDYCLFLISRFREEMAGAHSSHHAVHETVRTVGETITSSAGTVVVGLSTMALAELGLFNTTGPSVAVAVVIGLLAGLTFTPSLLSILGDKAFWPRKSRHFEEGRFWKRWADLVTQRPVRALVLTMILLVPLAVYGKGIVRDFDLLADLPKDNGVRRGFDVLASHLGAGAMQPLTIVVIDDHGFNTPEGLKRLTDIQDELEGVTQVTLVRSIIASLEQGHTLSVAKQLNDHVASLQAGTAELERALAASHSSVGGENNGGNPNLGPDSALLEKASEDLLDLFNYLRQLATQYPETSIAPGYRQAISALGNLAQIAGVSLAPGLVPSLSPTSAKPGSNSPRNSDLAPVAAANTSPTDLSRDQVAALLSALKELTVGIERLRDTWASHPDALMLPEVYLKNNEGLRRLSAAYLSTNAKAARFQVVLDVSPYSTEAVEAVSKLRRAISKSGTTGVVEGSSAIVADLRDASARDMTRALISVLLGILVVLILLLRSLVAPLCLIGTILLSYGATLGVVRLVFSDALGVSGVTWWVPIFMFVMLVALGMDYNIFLMGRVKEEAAEAANREGTRRAVARTGGIITSAGIIMAGTFAAMTSSTILGLVQIGFAVAVGVLLDTFVVRTALVPAITVLLGRWSWWPQRRA